MEVALKIISVVLPTIVTIVALILNRNNFEVEFKVRIGKNKKSK